MLGHCDDDPVDLTNALRPLLAVDVLEAAADNGIGQ